MTRIRPTTRTRLGTVRITIPEFDLLNPADEVRLACAIEAGVLAAEALNRDENPLGATADELRQLVAAGHAAQRGFFLANLKLVASISHQWATRANLPVDELFQEGCVGLGEAIRRWDHCRGSKFSSFAYPLVEGAIMGAALLRCGELNVSRFQARTALEVRRACRRLEAQLGRQVDVAELARRLGRDEAAVARSLQLAPPSALSDALVNVLSWEEDYASIEEHDRATPPPWLSELPAQERVVLEFRYGFRGPQASCETLAERLGISESTVRRIEKRGLSRARRLLAAS